MRGRGRGLVGAGAVVAVAIWLNVNGAAAQAPTIPSPPDPTTAPTTVAPPDEGPAPTPVPQTEPTDTLPPGSPDAPPSPANPARGPGTTTTTVPAENLSGAGLSPPRTLEASASAAFGLDLSEIEALRRAARGKGPRAQEQDFGFDPALRFARAETATDGHGEALELGAEDEKIARVRSASAVAAGLMALLLTAMAVGALRQARTALPPKAGD